MLDHIWLGSQNLGNPFLPKAASHLSMDFDEISNTHYTRVLSTEQADLSIVGSKLLR